MRVSFNPRLRRWRRAAASLIALGVVFVFLVMFPQIAVPLAASVAVADFMLNRVCGGRIASTPTKDIAIDQKAGAP